MRGLTPNQETASSCTTGRTPKAIKLSHTCKGPHCTTRVSRVHTSGLPTPASNWLKVVSRTSERHVGEHVQAQTMSTSARAALRSVCVCVLGVFVFVFGNPDFQPISNCRSSRHSRKQPRRTDFFGRRTVEHGRESRCARSSFQGNRESVPMSFLDRVKPIHRHHENTGVLSHLCSVTREVGPSS